MKYFNIFYLKPQENSTEIRIIQFSQFRSLIVGAISRSRLLLWNPKKISESETAPKPAKFCLTRREYPSKIDTKHDFQSSKNAQKT